MPVEFLGIGATSDGSETRPRSGPSFDREYTLRLARAHEDNNWDQISGGRPTLHVITGGPAISFGGSSDAAYAVGAAEADIYCLWGEPLADTAEQITRIRAAAAAAGRTDVPRIQVAFRPILGVTEDAAWEKAHRTVETIVREEITRRDRAAA